MFTGTTIIAVRKGNKGAIGGDVGNPFGQNTIMKQSPQDTKAFS